MELTFNEVKNILETLPIGLYAGYRISATLSADSNASYYKMMEDEIVISYQNVMQTIKHLDADSDYAETAVRSLLYHEVSHALLTPKALKPTDIINIFEDERIEVLNKYFFRNVNFKENVIRLNGYTGQAPTNAMEDFYHTVRFRQGDPALLKQVNAIIDKYDEMTSTKYNTSWGWSYDAGCDHTGSYIKDIYDLYNVFAKKWNEPPRDHYHDEANQTGEAQGFLSGDKVKVGENLSPEEAEAMAKILSNANNEVDKTKAGMNVDSANKLASTITSAFYNKELTDNLERILDGFHKKNMGGSSINAYSGVFNPRNVARKDYKYFDHKMPINGNNIFGTFHLNLFIDDSGSMCGNTQLMNQLLYTLMAIEKKNKNFTFDFYTCADRIEKADKKKGYEARGGTHLRKAIVPLFKQAQKPGTFNYNLVLFDGSASTDPYIGGNTFKVFDTSNTTIITDDSNRRNLTNNNTCKIIYCNDYVKEFYNHVYLTLQAAFR